jgi:peptidoglycan/LPS O-acetylase OafA/YrhL
MKTLAPHDYRPDVDGLRAIAVLAVIIFHANSSLLPNGFVGVDFFFVISGFLITRLLVLGIEDGTFSFADFYARRIKRIFPAYIVVAVATFVVASYLLIPDDYLFYTTSLAASFAFVSNVFFSMLSWGYFGDRTAEFPLLHTWSLSVEEQFYFIFPLVLIGLYRYCRRYVFPALILIALVFLLISEYKVAELKSYFLITTRAHELLIGALTFFLSRRFPAQPGLGSEALGTVGLAFMLASTFMFKDGDTFPGLNSLYPCIGTALVIYSGQANTRLSKLLANKLFVAIGLISYSLYLWHWPIFSFLKYRHIEMTLAVGIAAVALAFVLSILTYKFVETPVRHNKKLHFKPAFFRIYALPASAFLAVGLYSFVTNGAPIRFSGETRELIASYSVERDLSRACSGRAEDYQKVSVDYLHKHCAFGNPAKEKADILLMGDSHADHFKFFVEELAKHANMKAVYHVQGSCSPLNMPKQGEKVANDLHGACKRHNADLLEMAGNFQYVVLGGFWSSEADQDFAKDLESVVERILEKGAIPVVFKDNPHFEKDISKCVLHRHRGWLPADTNCNIPKEYVTKVNGKTDEAIDIVRAQHPEMLVIDPKLVMCSSKECLTAMGNTALFKDSNHINAKASKLLGNEYLAKVNNPFQPPLAAKKKPAELAVQDSGGMLKKVNQQIAP